MSDVVVRGSQARGAGAHHPGAKLQEENGIDVARGSRVMVTAGLRRILSVRRRGGSTKLTIRGNPL
jgi:hypothetical protein